MLMQQKTLKCELDHFAPALSLFSSSLLLHFEAFLSFSLVNEMRMVFFLSASQWQGKTMLTDQRKKMGEKNNNKINSARDFG